LLTKRLGIGSIEAGKGIVIIASEGPSEGAADVKLSVIKVYFEK
jgi:hypothetical protein